MFEAYDCEADNHDRMAAVDSLMVNLLTIADFCWNPLPLLTLVGPCDPQGICWCFGHFIYYSQAQVCTTAIVIIQ